MISDRVNILMLDKGIRLDLRNELQRHAQTQLMEAERISAIGSMACSISHDMRHSLTAIYANAEFLEHDNLCVSERAAFWNCCCGSHNCPLFRPQTVISNACPNGYL
jgi:signal transduction histidine kinase